MDNEDIKLLEKSIISYISGVTKNPTHRLMTEEYPLTEKTITSASIFYLAQIIQKYLMR